MSNRIKFYITLQKLYKNAAVQISRYGLVKSLGLYSYKIAKRLFGVEIYAIIELPDEKIRPRGNNPYAFSRVTYDEWLSMADFNSYDLDEAFLINAYKKGDECFGAYLGNELATYLWLAKSATRLTENVLIEPSQEYVYCYKAYTLKKYRGRKILSSCLLEAYTNSYRKDHKGVLALVEYGNYSSFNAFYSMGFKQIGRVFYLERKKSSIVQTKVTKNRLLVSIHGQ